MINSETFSLNTYNIIEAFINKIKVLVLNVFQSIVYLNNFEGNPFFSYILSVILTQFKNEDYFNLIIILKSVKRRINYFEQKCWRSSFQ